MKTFEFFVPGSPKPQGSVVTFCQPHIKKLISKTIISVMRKEIRLMTAIDTIYKASNKSIVFKNDPVLKAWRKDIALYARQKYLGKPVNGPIQMLMKFYVCRPKNHYGTGKNAGKLKPSAPEHPKTRAKGDVDKLTRAVFDALTGVIYEDDAQVWIHTSVKVYCDSGASEGVNITLTI